MNRLGLALAGLLSCTSGCDKEQAAPRRTEPWLASASASSAAAPRASSELRFSPESSSIRFSMPGRKATPGGQVPLARGTLQLRPSDLKASTASIDADLTRLTLEQGWHAAEGELPGDPPSVLALQWLELGADVPAERRAQFSVARFELVSLENLSATTLDDDLQKRRPVQVRATAVGTLLLHGYRAPVRAEVLLQTLPPTPTSQLRLSIRSAAPLVLPLAPHDIVARGRSGTPDPLQTARAEASIGKSLRIEFELVAESSN